MERASQWDIRINVPSPQKVVLNVENVNRRFDNENVVYVHVSNVEVGDSSQRHIHIGLVLHNRTSKSSIIRKYVLNPEDGFYVAPRDTTKDINAWVEYHGKRETKLDPNVPFLLKRGDLPRPKRTIDPETRAAEDDQKRNQRVTAWSERKRLMKENKWDELDERYPGFIWSTAGQNMKREIVKQANDEHCETLQGPLNNFIIWGPSGSGKSSSVSLLYPQCYKKQKGTQYWDAYDRLNPDHSVVWIDEMSKETLKTLTGKTDGGFEFLKELGDRYAVTVDEKYTKGYKIRPQMIVITMNEHPESLLPRRAIEVNKQALYRKFKILHVTEWLSMNGLMNTPNGVKYKYEATV